jgi:hypothetical protein
LSMSIVRMWDLKNQGFSKGAFWERGFS